MSTPNTTIRLMSGVPLDNTYRHTYRWASKNDRDNFFGGSTFTWEEWTSQYWQRINSNTIRLGTSGDFSDKWFPYNYLRFKNRDYEYIYAFITEVNYINDNVVEIKYEIDVMTTYYFCWSFQQCFVLREHSSTDGVGDNRQPEPFDITGDYVTRQQWNIGWDSYSILFFYAPSSSGWAYQTLNGQVAMCSVEKWDVTSSYTELETILTNNASKKLLTAFYTPTEFYSTSDEYQQDFTFRRALSGIGSYVPVNNKLYTYPYCYVEVSNQRGDTAIYQWEEFTSGEAQFRVYGACYPKPSALITPLNYNGTTTNNFDIGVYIKAFPEVIAQSETFSYYYATHANSSIGSAIVSGLTGLATGAMVGNIPGAVLGGAIGLGGSLIGAGAKMSDVKNSASPVTSATSQDVLNSLTGHGGYVVSYKSAQWECLQKIDTFFTKYGYATNKVKAPNRWSRESFSYVQTLECAITSNQLPVEAAKKICEIHDKGITYWSSNKTVGDYTQRNNIS